MIGELMQSRIWLFFILFYPALPFLTFEQMCIQFNIAALQSQLAAERRVLDTDEELKTAAKWFQVRWWSVETFNHGEGTFIHYHYIVDISLWYLGCFRTLCSFVQFSHHFTWRCTHRGFAPKYAVGNVCTHVGTSPGDLCPESDKRQNEGFNRRQTLYTSGGHVFRRLTQNDKGECETPIRSDLANKRKPINITEETAQHVQLFFCFNFQVAGKQFSYGALAQFFQSRVCNVNKSIGEEIARLNTAVGLFKKAQEKTGNPSIFSYYVTEGTRLAASAKKDNDFIYHEAIPSAENLATIEKVATARLAKPTPVQPQLSLTFKDL